MHKRRARIERERAEDAVWTRDVRGVLGELTDNIADIWHYGFTEIFNNAVEHSGGDRVRVAAQQVGHHARVPVCGMLPTPPVMGFPSDRIRPD